MKQPIRKPNSLLLAGLAAAIMCLPVAGAQLTINSVNIARTGVGYTPSSQTPQCGPSVIGVGFDGFDCGLNLVVTNSQPGLVTAPGSVNIGTAQLAERALIAFNTFPKGDGNSINDYTLTVNFNVSGTPLTFIGNATDYVGGAPASGNQAMIAACADPLQTTFPQCVNDTALDFRIAFSGAQTLTIGADQIGFSLRPLEFFNNLSPINVVLDTTITTQAVPEPTSFALLGMGVAVLSLMRRRRR